MPSNKHIRVLTPSGLKHLRLGRGDASLVGQYWNALRRYLEFGDSAQLDRFVGVTVGRGRAVVQLETDLDVIDWHAHRGEVEFESIYEEVV